MGDALRLAVGLLSLVPVRPVAPDRRTAARAMTLAPLVGLGLGLAAAAVLFAGRVLTGQADPPLLPAALAVLTLAALTRGLHLDGLADTADGLGAGGDPPRRLAVMCEPGVGAFGVTALVAALLVDTVALSTAVQRGHGTVAVVAAAVTGRLALTWACRRGVTAARPGGLGAAVAGTVGWVWAAGVTVLALAAGAVAGAFDEHAGPGGAARVVVAVLAGLLAGEALRRYVGARLGGVTGDVLGAAVEVSTLVALVVMTAAPGLFGG